MGEGNLYCSRPPPGRSSKGATASTYVPRKDDKSTKDVMEQDDNGYYLRVTATYTDVTSDPDLMTTTSVYIDERTLRIG